MRYADAIAALESALRFGLNPSLDGIRALTEALDRPQDAFAVVQVTGTNGKSSVTRLIESILCAEGVKTGAYTSPHLQSYTERIEIGGVPVSEEEFALAMRAALGAAETARTAAGGAAAAGPLGAPASFTEFELLTAAALWLFRERGVDVAVLEVGMGGRWDATSVADPAVAVVTGVGLDHTERLGDTVQEIAADKARIIKPGSSVVLGPETMATAAIFLERAHAFDLHPRFVAHGSGRSPVSDDLTVRFDIVERPSAPGGTLVLDVRCLHGSYRGLSVVAPSYQAPNVATALAAAECALGRGLRADRLRDALACMTFPGRFELVRADPPIVLDGAHNPQAASALASAIDEAWPDEARRPDCVLGILSDKDAAGIVDELARVVGRFRVTQPDTPRAMPAAGLATLVRERTGIAVELAPSLRDAIDAVRVRGASCGVIVTGSLYTVGQAREILVGR